MSIDFPPSSLVHQGCRKAAELLFHTKLSSLSSGPESGTPSVAPRGLWGTFTLLGTVGDVGASVDPSVDLEPRPSEGIGRLFPIAEFVKSISHQSASRFGLHVIFKLFPQAIKMYNISTIAPVVVGVGVSFAIFAIRLHVW